MSEALTHSLLQLLWQSEVQEILPLFVAFLSKFITCMHACVVECCGAWGLHGY